MKLIWIALMVSALSGCGMLPQGSADNSPQGSVDSSVSSGDYIPSTGNGG